MGNDALLNDKPVLLNNIQACLTIDKYGEAGL